MSADGAAAVPGAAALELAQVHRLPVFPCSQEKAPLTRRGFKDASTDPGRITRWWSAHPDALVGVPTGSRTGVLVVDVDPEGEAWRQQHAHELEDARSHRTRRGMHLLYRWPPGIRNSASKIAPGVDVRGEGGYVIWWPVEGLEAIGSLDELTLPPPWLHALLTKPPEKPQAPPPKVSKPKARPRATAPPVAVSEPLEVHTETPAGTEGEPKTAIGYVTEGGRNDYLSREAYRLRMMGASVDRIMLVLPALNMAMCCPPLDLEEVTKIARGKERLKPEPEAREPWLPIPRAVMDSAAWRAAQEAGAIGTLDLLAAQIRHGNNVLALPREYAAKHGIRSARLYRDLRILEACGFVTFLQHGRNTARGRAENYYAVTWLPIPPPPAGVVYNAGTAPTARPLDTWRTWRRPIGWQQHVQAISHVKDGGPSRTRRKATFKDREADLEPKSGRPDLGLPITPQKTH